MIVGLHGKMGSGKNECARRLALLSPLPVVEIAWAAKLKQSLAAFLGVTVEQLEAWKNDPAVVVGVVKGKWLAPPISMRTAFQRYGTEAHRDVFGYDFWLDHALPLDRDYSDALYVVTDVRFQNEADRVHDAGGLVFLVAGPDADTGGHVSERPLECDWTIDNTIRDDDYRFLDAQLRTLLAYEAGRPRAPSAR